MLFEVDTTIIHIDVCAVYLHKSSVKFTNLFLGSPFGSDSSCKRR